MIFLISMLICSTNTLHIYPLYTKYHVAPGTWLNIKRIFHTITSDK